MSATEETELDLAAIGRFMDAALVPRGPDLSATLVSGGRSNLTYRLTDGHARWILRRPPLGRAAGGAHDVAREHRVMAALRDTPVPVPVVTALCEDPAVLGASFYLMEEVDGDVLRTPHDTGALSVPDRQRLGAEMVDTLADLHDVDVDAINLATLGRPDGFLDRQLDRWQRQYHSVAVRDLPQVDSVSEILRASRPQHSAVALVHGDFRLDNVIVDHDDPGIVRAVLDWEMATLGDPLADLGMLLMFWDEPGRPFNPITGGQTAMEGFPSIAEVVERYAGRREADMLNLDWYLCFSLLKLAVILEQIHARHLAGQTRGDGFDQMDQMVDQLLGEAVRGAASLPRRIRTP